MNWEPYKRKIVGHCSDCAFQYDAYKSGYSFDGSAVTNKSYWGRMKCGCADSPLFDKPNPVPDRSSCSYWQKDVIVDE